MKHTNLERKILILAFVSVFVLLINFASAATEYKTGNDAAYPAGVTLTCSPGYTISSFSCSCGGDPDTNTLTDTCTTGASSCYCDCWGSSMDYSWCMDNGWPPVCNDNSVASLSMTCATSECPGANYIFSTDLWVAGSGCYSPSKTQDTLVLNVNKGTYRVEARSERGNPYQAQTSEKFYFNVNGQTSLISQDDSNANSATARWDNFGNFNFNQGSNTFTMNTATTCPPATTPNSVDISKICLYRQISCGDGVCDSGETCSTCSSDCGACSCTLPWGGTISSGASVTAYLTSSVAYGSTCSSQTRTCTNGVLSGSYTFSSCTVSEPSSCTLPWGGTISSGASVTAYLTSSVAYGSTCTSQTRTCTNGVLSGSYTFSSCTVDGPSSCTLPWGGTISSGAGVTAYLTSSVAYGSTCSSQTRTCTNGVLSGSYTYSNCTVNNSNCDYYYWFDDDSKECNFKEFCGAYIYLGLHIFETEEDCLNALDADGDGYNGSVDCNDNNYSIHPGATETCDGVDNNCDGVIDENCMDNDNDGYPSDIDCNDNNASIHPGATEVCEDLVDNDCDGRIDEGCNDGEEDDDDRNDFEKEDICYPKLQCSGWSDCDGGFQTRICEDINLCESSFNDLTERRLCDDYETKKIILELENAEKKVSLWSSLWEKNCAWVFPIFLLLIVIIILLTIFLIFK